MLFEWKTTRFYKEVSRGHKIQVSFCIASFLGSGDMDGMNKVDIVTVHLI